MANYLVKGRRITLSGNPSMGTYTVEIAGQTWSMTERPYVRFADGTVVPFPAPETEGPCRTGTTEGIAAVYTDFGGHNPHKSGNRSDHRRRILYPSRGRG